SLSCRAARRERLSSPTRRSSDLTGTVGDRVRQKRRLQAEFLAQWLQARQLAEPDANLIVLGDFNAFEFNDGYVDVMGTVTGAPSDRKSTRLNSSHVKSSYAVFCL